MMVSELSKEYMDGYKFMEKNMYLYRVQISLNCFVLFYVSCVVKTYD